MHEVPLLIRQSTIFAINPSLASFLHDMEEPSGKIWVNIVISTVGENELWRASPRTQASMRGFAYVYRAEYVKIYRFIRYSKNERFYYFFSPLFANTSFHFHSVYKQSCNQYIKIMFEAKKKKTTTTTVKTIFPRRDENRASQRVHITVVLLFSIYVRAFLLSWSLVP